jgi:hypothetical protein
MEDDLHLLDKDIEPYVDVFVPLLLKECEETLLPELISVFGESELLKFLDVFAGTTFEVPDRSIIVRLARDARIYVALTKTDITYAELSSEYDLKEESLRKCYNRVESILKAVGANVAGRKKKSGRNKSR